MVRPFALVLSIESHSSNKILRNNKQQSTYLYHNKCRDMLAGGWWAGGRTGIHYGWGGGSTTSYSTNN
jgi:hypothetical protein